jgi:hypothetical protein
MIELTLVCDGCERTIAVPISTPPEKARRQLTLASTEWPRNLLCPHCNQVFAYPVKRFGRTFRDMLDQSEPREYPASVSIQVKCGDSNCQSLVRVVAIVNISDDIKSDAVGAIAIARYGQGERAVTCLLGHKQSGKPQSGSVRVELEAGW